MLETLSRSIPYVSNLFCVVCANYVAKKKFRKFTQFLRQSYENFYETHYGYLDEIFVPKGICSICDWELRNLEAGSSTKRFFIPVIWKKPENHAQDC